MDKVQALLQSCGVDVTREDPTAAELPSRGKHCLLKSNYLRHNFEETLVSDLPCGCCCDLHHSWSLHHSKPGKTLGTTSPGEQEVFVEQSDEEEEVLVLDAAAGFPLKNDEFMAHIVSLQTDFDLGCYHLGE